jgi:hypothetical protein
MNERKFIRAEDGPDNAVVYYDEGGNKLIRYWKGFEGQPVNEASTRSWRNNNPGNLIMGPFSRRNGAIGDAGRVPNSENKNLKFAVFPDFAAGRKAQATRLREGNVYIDLTLNELPRKYVGLKVDQPDTQEVINYRKDIKFFTKFDMDRTIRSLNDEEYGRLLDAMMKHEGWRAGREEYVEVEKILGVHIDTKHVIWEFLIGNSMVSKWVSKKEAITLAEGGLLAAVVVHTKKSSYLRPKFHTLSFRQLVCR